jgi:trimethylamine--corrinoid protein Co-methyltransferase
MLSSSMNFERWKREGALDASARAAKICQKTLDDYEPPPLDGAIRAELEEYVIRRRAELGD